MRSSVLAAAAMGLVVGGCGIKVPFLPQKPAMVSAPKPPKPAKKIVAMPTRPSCPAMADADWKPVLDGAIHKAFDRTLRKRYRDTAVQFRAGWSRDDHDNVVLTAHRIGPAGYALPEPGEGGEVEVVFRACTGEVIKTRKLASLERKPRALSAVPASN